MGLSTQDVDSKNVRRFRLLRLARQMFALGALILCPAVLLAALLFTGTDGAPFSPFNVSVSELGTYGYSPLAVLANGGLFFGGLVLVLGSLQGLRTVQGLGILVWLALAAAWLALALSGLFPSNVYHLHTAALKWFFYCALLAGLGYLLWLALGKSKPQSPLALVFCALMLLFVSAFLLLPQLSLASVPFSRPFYEEAYSPYPRPLWWWPAALEWSSLLSLLLWQAEMLRRPD